jgi:hypothetical protein
MVVGGVAGAKGQIVKRDASKLCSVVVTCFSFHVEWFSPVSHNHLHFASLSLAFNCCLILCCYYYCYYLLLFPFSVVIPCTCAL